MPRRMMPDRKPADDADKTIDAFDPREQNKGGKVIPFEKKPGADPEATVILRREPEVTSLMHDKPYTPEPAVPKEKMASKIDEYFDALQNRGIDIEQQKGTIIERLSWLEEAFEDVLKQMPTNIEVQTLVDEGIMGVVWKKRLEQLRSVEAEQQLLPPSILLDPSALQFWTQGFREQLALAQSIRMNLKFGELKPGQRVVITPPDQRKVA